MWANIHIYAGLLLFGYTFTMLHENPANKKPENVMYVYSIAQHISTINNNQSTRAIQTQQPLYKQFSI